MKFDEMWEQLRDQYPDIINEVERYAKQLDAFVAKDLVMKEYCRDCAVEDCKDYCVDVQWILDLPASDVQPVVHGHWIHLRKNYCRCSVCGTAYNHPVDWTPDKYCSECGAKLDEEATM